jgi:glycosyltransferase involved in cell wall biosynthesis
VNVQEAHGLCHFRNPLVSVVVPAFNGEDFIDECLSSIERQTYTPLHTIVVDDASTDRTAELAVLHNVSLIRNPVNCGECRTSMYGCHAASGKYITRLRQDDVYVDPDHILNQVKVMERTSADFCYDTKTYIGSNPGSSEVIKTKWLFTGCLDNLILQFPHIAFEIWKRRNPINSSSLMFRASSLSIVNYPTKYRTTWDSIILGRMLKRGMSGVAIDAAGVFWRTHPKQTYNNPLYWKELAEIKKGDVES